MFKTLLAILVAPLRFLITSFIDITDRGNVFYIYMKSGNVVKIRAKTIKWEKKGDDYTRLEWKTPAVRKFKLHTIDIGQIEAIVSRW